MTSKSPGLEDLGSPYSRTPPPGTPEYSALAQDLAHRYLHPTTPAERDEALRQLYQLGTGNKLNLTSDGLEAKSNTEDKSEHLGTDVLREYYALKHAMHKIRWAHVQSGLPLPNAVHSLATRAGVVHALCSECAAQATDKPVPYVFTSIAGGTALHGKTGKCDTCGSVIKTLWLVLPFYIPLIPLGSYRVMYDWDTANVKYTGLGRQDTVSIVGNRLSRLHIGQVATVYGILVASLGLLAVGVMLLARTK